jgi:hypothetical protein
MAFPSFPYNDDDNRSFPHHTSVRTYLERYTDSHPEVRSLIRFDTPVLEVKPLDGETIGGTTELSVLPKWQVVTSTATNEVFDAVVVCNGHYSKPNKPEIAGESTFPGRVWHSHTYREPSVFTGQRVLVLGAAASAVDICREVATTASAVYISHSSFADKAGGSFPNDAAADAAIIMCPQLKSLGTDGSAIFESAPAKTNQPTDGDTGTAFAFGGGAFEGTAAEPAVPRMDMVLLCTGSTVHCNAVQ